MARRLFIAAALALAAFVAPAAAAPAVTAAAAAHAAAFAAAARAVDAGGQLQVSGLRLDGEGADSALQLRRFEVWAPGAVVWVQAAPDAPPMQMRPPAGARYFRGSIAGSPGSAAVLAVLPDGSVDGFVLRNGSSSWSLGRPAAPPGASAAATAAAAAAPLATQRADASLAARRPFRCGLDTAAAGSGPAAGTTFENAHQPAARALLQVRGGCGTVPALHSARSPAVDITLFPSPYACDHTHDAYHPSTPIVAVGAGPVPAGHRSSGDGCCVPAALQRRGLAAGRCPAVHRQAHGA